MTVYGAFAAALAAFQAELPSVGKDQTAQIKSDKGQFSYQFADLTKISEKAYPLLSKHGLAFTANPTMGEHGFVLRYLLMHTEGQSIGGDYPLPDPTRSTAQQIGSAITYARRYCLCAATGIAPGGEDDDGAEAAAAPAQQPQRTTPLRAAQIRVWNLAKARKWTEDDLAQDFAATHEGETLTSADVDALTAYAVQLEMSGK